MSHERISCGPNYKPKPYFNVQLLQAIIIPYICWLALGQKTCIGNTPGISSTITVILFYRPLSKGPRFDSGPGLILGSWIMMRHVSCILLLEWSTTSQRLWVYRISVSYAQNDPRFLFKKIRGQSREFWSLVSTIDGSTLPQDCVEDLLCGTQINW